MRNAEVPLYVRLLAGLVKPFPNFDFAFIKPVRRRAVALLRLRPGARVLDAGCGSGGSFHFLAEGVGPGGKVLGVEISPVSGLHARRRIEANGWKNVEVLICDVHNVELTETYDGLLMFAAPDVYASREALDRIWPSLEDGARIVLFGSKKSSRRFGWLLNGLLDIAMTKLSLASTPSLEPDPWSQIAPRTQDLQVQEYFHGWMFLASGTARR